MSTLTEERNVDENFDGHVIRWSRAASLWLMVEFLLMVFGVRKRRDINSMLAVTMADKTAK